MSDQDIKLVEIKDSETAGANDQLARFETKSQTTIEETYSISELRKMIKQTSEMVEFHKNEAVFQANLNEKYEKMLIFAESKVIQNNKD